MDAHIEIQGKKLKKAFLLTLAKNDDESEQPDPKRARMQIAAEEDGGFSLEQQEHFSIDSLELWRDTASAGQAQAQAQSAGEQYLEHLRRTAAQLRVQAASATTSSSTAANTSSSSSASSASGESLAAVGVHMQRALVEATQLVQLSGMLKAGHFAGLRTSFRAIRRERGPPLPPLQVAHLLQRRFQASSSAALEDAIEDALQAVSQRRRLCEGLVQLKRSWRLSFYDKRTRREVSAQQFDPSRCSLAVNCPALPLPVQLHVSPGPGEGPGASGVGGGLVPLVVDAQGNYKVAEAAARIPHRTLVVSVLHRESGQVVACESLWAVRGLLGDPGGPDLRRGPGDRAGAGAGGSGGLDSPSIREVNGFCERRRHTLLSELLLNSLRGEVAQAAERWPAHSRSSQGQGQEREKGQGQEDSSWLDEVLLHDPVDGALSLLLLGDEGALELAFTAALKVRFVLQPIPDPIPDPMVQVEGRPWLRLALRICLLQMHSLLVTASTTAVGPPLLGGAPLSEAAGKAAPGKGQPSAKDHSSPSPSCSLVRAAMDVLRRRLYRYRAEQLAAVREGFWAVTLTEKAAAGGGRLSLLADEFRFELRTPRGDLLTELAVCGKGKSFATVSFAYHGTMGEVRVAPRWPRAAVSFDSFRQLQMFLRKAKLHQALGQVSALMIEQCSAALFRIVRLVSSGDQVVATVTVLLPDDEGEAAHPDPAAEGAPLSGVRLRVESPSSQGQGQEVALEGCDSVLLAIPVLAHS